ncbi:MAG: hypothetical protein H0T93_13165 [Chloroflexia bacterium]|nr:hypothetical protein [Chloroflexia bacterium]
MIDQDPTLPVPGYHPIGEDGSVLRRYERPHEVGSDTKPEAAPAVGEVIPFESLPERLVGTALTAGAQTMLMGLLRLGRSAIFPGGGVGIEYGGLLKTAARPDHVGRHVREAAVHLRSQRVDLLVVPGMSGYPVGSMYSIVSGIPAVLLKKQKHIPGSDATRYPTGSFVIPSYTGDGDVVMSADLPALQDVVDCVLAPQMSAQADAEMVRLTVRVAGADDIIDKATMSQAVSESALIVGEAAVERFVARYRFHTGDTRPVEQDVQVVTWVTPLIKGYNRPQEHLNRWFGISPFAGLNVTSVHLDPPALGIDGLGVAAFAIDTP